MGLIEGNIAPHPTLLVGRAFPFRDTTSHPLSLPVSINK